MDRLSSLSHCRGPSGPPKCSLCRLHRQLRTGRLIIVTSFLPGLGFASEVPLSLIEPNSKRVSSACVVTCMRIAHLLWISFIESGVIRFRGNICCIFRWSLDLLISSIEDCRFAMIATVLRCKLEPLMLLTFKVNRGERHVRSLWNHNLLVKLLQFNATSRILFEKLCREKEVIKCGLKPSVTLANT